MKQELKEGLLMPWTSLLLMCAIVGRNSEVVTKTSLTYE
jgi:hypothetical protein